MYIIAMLHRHPETFLLIQVMQRWPWAHRWQMLLDWTSGCLTVGTWDLTWDKYGRHMDRLMGYISKLESDEVQIL